MSPLRSMLVLLFVVVASARLSAGDALTMALPAQSPIVSDMSFSLIMFPFVNDKM